MQIEQWKPVFDGRYQVSNHGRVRRMFVGEAEGRIMNQKILDGYALVSISPKRGDLTTWHRVHRLVALAFIPLIEGKNVVNHINLNRSDNRVENLEWCTQSENMYHAAAQNKILRGSGRPNTHLTEEDVLAIRTRRSKGEDIDALADEYDISLGTISVLLRGITWKHVPGALGKKMTPPAAKLTEEQVRAIRTAHTAGAKQKELSEQFGVNTGTISMIVNRRIWKHVT